MAESVAGAFLSGVFNVLLDRLASREVLNFLRGQKNDGGRRNVGLILKKLKSKLLVLQAVLDDAENKQFTRQAVKDWLDELKHVVYQADDLLDKVNYQVLRCKVEAEYQKDPIDQKTQEPAKQMSALPSLQSLDISSCSEIQSFSLLPSTLQSLYISHLPNLKYLRSLYLLVSLQRLRIEDCSKLESLPEDGLPPSLSHLRIRNCPLLEPRLQRDNGDEWHKIAHIRDIQIGPFK